MTMAELNIWSAYRHKYGPMNDVRRFDGPAAIVASMVNNAHGGKAKPADLMPYGKEKPVESEEEFTPDHVLKILGKGVKVGKRG